MPLTMHAPSEASRLFVELGIAIVGLALLARLANRWGLSAIPLYLLSGLAFGTGGLAPLPVSHDFVRIGSEIGVALLLFMLGLEFTGSELASSLRTGLPGGVVDALLNFIPGLAAGWLFGWGPLGALLLGGVTYISSSGIVAKALGDLGRLGDPETPTILSLLVLEDLAMAAFLPLIAVLMIGQSLGAAALSIAAALATVGGVVLVAARYGGAISRRVAHESDEVILLTVFGAMLLIAGLAQQLHVSAAVGAFLAGLVLSGPAADHARRLVAPLRDLFAAVFFFFFGLQIDPATLPPVLPAALGLGAITAATKVMTGVWAAGRAGIPMPGRLRVGAALVARGEFSVVIADLGGEAAWGPELRAFSAAYVLLMAILGPVLVRVADRARPAAEA